jgi:hypothetical protein
MALGVENKIRNQHLGGPVINLTKERIINITTVPRAGIVFLPVS